MQKRVFFIVFLAVAFLLGAWGNVIAAAFCPRYLSNRECHLKSEPHQPRQVDHESSCQHEMADMDMTDMQMDNMEMGSEPAQETAQPPVGETQPDQAITEFSAELPAINFPTEPCGHCWIHSQPAPGTATVVAVDPTKRLVETSALPPSVAVALPSANIVPITRLEHGPPGNSSPRHILINVFRI